MLSKKKIIEFLRTIIINNNYIKVKELKKCKKKSN